MRIKGLWEQSRKEADEINEVRQELQNCSGTWLGFSEERQGGVITVVEMRI